MLYMGRISFNLQKEMWKISWKCLLNSDVSIFNIIKVWLKMLVVESCHPYQCDMAYVVCRYTGKACNIDIDDCASQPCKRGEVCTDGVNGYSCSCLPGVSCTDSSSKQSLGKGKSIWILIHQAGGKISWSWHHNRLLPEYFHLQWPSSAMSVFCCLWVCKYSSTRSEYECQQIHILQNILYISNIRSVLVYCIASFFSQLNDKQKEGPERA